jgi:hypothetical protein
MRRSTNVLAQIRSARVALEDAAAKLYGVRTAQAHLVAGMLMIAVMACDEALRRLSGSGRRRTAAKQ